MKKYNAFILKHMHALRYFVLTSFSIIVLRGLISTISPFLYSKFINSLVASKSFSIASGFALTYGLSIFSNIIAGYFETTVLRSLLYKIENNFINLKLNQILGQFHHDNQFNSQEVDRSRKDIKQISSFICFYLLSAPVQIARILICFYLVSNISIQLGVFLICLPLLLQFIFKKFKSHLNKLDLQLKNSDSKIQSELIRFFSKLNLILRHSAEPMAFESIAGAFDEYKKTGLQTAKHNYLFSSTNQIVFFIFNVSTMLICAFLYEKSLIQIGHIGLTLAYFGQFNDLFSQLIQVGREYNESQISFERSLLESVDLNIQSIKPQVKVMAKPTNGQSELRVAITYIKRGNRHILQNFNQVFKGGEIYQIKNKNGAGKTSLLHVIAAEKIEAEGTVVYSGSFNHATHLPILLHSQTSEFYFDKVKQNFDFWKVERNSEEVKHIFSKLYKEYKLEDFLKMDVNALSGGQKQKLQIMLNILKDTNVILLDEPFAGLDSQTIESLKQLLCELSRQGKITIVISHDQSLSELGTKIISIGG